ncbi:class I SAM-dependent methyltransferase [Methylocaldum sp.]|uniref:class I SAM-dependent methyltransferase n=1 Tax=Methylocaldum sp. TaxID=1969727 RepID=UPI003220275B
MLLGMGITGWLFIGEVTLIILSTLSVAVIVFFLLEVYRRLSEERRDDLARQQKQRSRNYEQIEALFSLFFTLKPTLPLPATRGWAASPDFLKKLMELILTTKPGFVVEASSGVSTLVIAYCLKRLGAGMLVSLEHEAKYAIATRNLLSFHHLGEFATVVHAPLKEIMITGRKWLWYDTDSFKIEQPIDLLVIDGPPKEIQKLSRYPALPLLYAQLSDKSTIILDDGRRDDEKEIVTLWEKQFSSLFSEYFDTETGAYVLRKID